MNQRYTIEQYVDSPITSHDEKRIKVQFEKQNELAKRLFIPSTLVCLVFAITVYLSLSTINANFAAKLLIPLAVVGFGMIPIWSLVSIYVKKRYTVTLSIGERVYSDANLFSDDEVEMKKLQSSELATELLSNINKLNRKPYKFEKDIMSHLCDI